MCLIIYIYSYICLCVYICTHMHTIFRKLAVLLLSGEKFSHFTRHGYYFVSVFSLHLISLSSALIDLEFNNLMSQRWS